MISFHSTTFPECLSTPHLSISTLYSSLFLEKLTKKIKKHTNHTERNTYTQTEPIKTFSECSDGFGS